MAISALIAPPSPVNEAGCVVGHVDRSAGNTDTLAAAADEARNSPRIGDSGGTVALNGHRALNEAGAVVDDDKAGTERIDACQVGDVVGNIDFADGSRIIHRQRAIAADAIDIPDAAAPV